MFPRIQISRRAPHRVWQSVPAPDAQFSGSQRSFPSARCRSSCHVGTCSAAVKLGELLSKQAAGILATAIRMHHQARSRLLAGQRHHQRIQDKLCVNRRAHRPADDLLRAQIFHCRHVQEAFIGRQWSERPGVVELSPGLSAPNRTCTFQRIRLSISSVAHGKDEISVTRFEDGLLIA